MSVPVEQPRRYTIAEYLAMEAASEEKHELFYGYIVAMSGGTYRHSIIASNVLVSLAN